MVRNTLKVLLLTAVVLAGGFMVLGVWLAVQRDRDRRRADEAAFAAEREADRAEAAAAFTAPVSPDPADAEFETFFGRLGAALDRGDEDAVTGMFNVDRMVAELARTGALDRLPGGRTPYSARDSPKGCGAGSAEAWWRTSSSAGPRRTSAGSAGRTTGKRWW